MRQTKAAQCCMLVLLLMVSGCSQIAAPVAPATATTAAVGTVAEAVALTPAQQQQFVQAKQLLNASDNAAALAILQPLFTQQPAAAGIGYNLAVSQWQLGNLAAAQHTLTQVVGVAPQYSDAHNLAGILARQQGHFRQAERHFQRALQAEQNYAIAHKNLAFLYELYLGEPLQAHYHYQQYFALTQDEQVKIWLALLEQQLKQEQGNE